MILTRFGACGAGLTGPLDTTRSIDAPRATKPAVGLCERTVPDGACDEVDVECATRPSFERVSRACSSVRSFRVGTTTPGFATTTRTGPRSLTAVPADGS